jgi:hypothetical protein
MDFDRFSCSSFLAEHAGISCQFLTDLSLGVKWKTSSAWSIDRFKWQCMLPISTQSHFWQFPSPSLWLGGNISLRLFLGSFGSCNHIKAAYVCMAAGNRFLRELNRAYGFQQAARIAEALSAPCQARLLKPPCWVLLRRKAPVNLVD